MSGNTFGRLFRLTTYGESHGPGLGGVVDGCPAGLPLSVEDIQAALDARRPGGGSGEASGTPRKEGDRVRLLSGVFEGTTTGTPIAFHVENENQHSADYDPLAGVLRPGHADLGFHSKYHVRDHRGGGRASGRETLARVAGGAIAARLLGALGVTVLACTEELGGVAANLEDIGGACKRAYFCPDEGTAALWESLALQAREEGDTLGGIVRVEVHGLPPGLGEPVFDKLDARLAYAFMGVGAVKGVEIGMGFRAARMRGSEHNDPLLPGDSREAAFVPAAGRLPSGAAFGFADNKAGGTLGGMSSGAPLVIRAAVKPISSIGKEQRAINLDGQAASIAIGGRHDVSAIPRIVPVLRAMACLVAADYALLQQSARLETLLAGMGVN